MPQRPTAGRGIASNGASAAPATPYAGAPYVCPVELTLAVIGGKWKPLIVWELRAGARGFNALQAALPGVTHKVLTQQLRQLERDGIVTRTARGGGPRGRVRRVDYALTAFGRTLRPSLNALARWAKAHHAAVGATLVQ